MNTPYTYLIGWSKLNVWYYGRQTASGCSPLNLWVTYFTSSNYVEDFRRLHGEPDVIEIRQTFTGNGCVRKCELWEETVIDRIGAVKSDRWLNKQGSKRFSTTGMTTVKDSNNNTFLVTTDDSRLQLGELSGIAKGTVTVVDLNGNKFRVAKSDPRYISGELVGVAKGTVTVVDKYNNKFRVAKTDPRYISKELVGVAKGTVVVKDKLGNKLRISKTDPRYVSGEVVPVNLGNKKVNV